jgi:hypothetical protein
VSFYEKMLQAMAQYEAKKKYFDEITRAYITSESSGRRILDQEARAASDPRRIKAAGDAAFFREEAKMYALAHIAQRAR